MNFRFCQITSGAKKELVAVHTKLVFSKKAPQRYATFKGNDVFDPPNFSQVPPNFKRCCRLAHQQENREIQALSGLILLTD